VSTFEFFISGDTTMKDAIKRLRQLRRAVHELDEEPATFCHLLSGQATQSTRRHAAGKEKTMKRPTESTTVKKPDSPRLAVARVALLDSVQYKCPTRALANATIAEFEAAVAEQATDENARLTNPVR
jgi:hypothetical protein